MEYNGDKHGFEVPISSIEDLTVAIREHLSISSSISVNFFDPELEEYVLIRDTSKLPSDKLRFKVVAQSLSWWAWNVNTAWTEKGFSANRYFSLLVKEGEKIHNQPALEKFNEAAAAMGFSPGLVHKVYAVSNDKLLQGFENYRDLLWGKHRKSPALFKKDDWTVAPEANQRQAYLDWSEKYAKRYNWNTDPSKPNVIPLLQGTMDVAAWQICQQGFGVTATTDDGYYGRGIYFTSKLGYASQYAKSGPDGKAFMLCVVIPGNSFPVTEQPFSPEGFKSGYQGQACRPGYQSHSTLVDGRNITKAFPIKGGLDENILADETVIFEGAQAMPMFVFYMK